MKRLDFTSWYGIPFCFFNGSVVRALESQVFSDWFSVGISSRTDFLGLFLFFPVGFCAQERSPVRSVRAPHFSASAPIYLLPSLSSAAHLDGSWSWLPPTLVFSGAESGTRL
jgi:hypothetical protein